MGDKNYFISFEGIDGSGKDTQLLKLLEAIKEENNGIFGNKYSNIWVTRNPSKITTSGIKISNLIRNKNVDGKTAARLYIQDRIEQSRIIENILKHSFVLTSRFDISTLTYQYAQGEDFDELFNLHRFDEIDGCLIPDLTIVFEIPAEISFKRISKRGEVIECFEKLRFQKELVHAQKYCIKRLKNLGRNIILVNANQSIEKVTEEMLNKIKSFFENNY